MNDRQRGALLGLAVGDALGTTQEFATPKVAPLPTLLSGPQTDLVGGGPFRLIAGQVTDDTQMAICLAQSLRAHHGFDADDIGRRYGAWRLVAFDIGRQTRDALALIEAGVPAAEAGERLWQDADPTRRPAGNGSLMRCAPIAVLLHGLADDELTRVAMAESAITHFDPRCQLACAAFAASLRAAIGGATPRAIVSAAHAALQRGKAQLMAYAPELIAEIVDAFAMLSADLDLAIAASPELYSQQVNLLDHQGYVRVAFRLAYWHLVHTADWRTALVDIVNRGGDADTNAAIAGALLGARDGASAIPAAWAELVLGELPSSCGDFATTYHPRHLF